MRPTAFLQTEEERKTSLRETFERLSTAKMVVEGIVVPHLRVSRVSHSDRECYCLTFITSLNKLYAVEFDSFFFQPNSNVQVIGPVTLDLHGSAKAFDLV